MPTLSITSAIASDDRARRPSMPVLLAVTPMCRPRPRSAPATTSGGISWKPETPTEFCTVTAVTAVVACTPQAKNVRQSAWHARPTAGSVPAMVSALGGVAPI